MAKPEHDNQGDDDFTDVTAMADVNIATETEHLATSAEIGTEIRGAPGGDEAASVNKNGEKTDMFGKCGRVLACARGCAASAINCGGTYLLTNIFDKYSRMSA